MGATANPHQTLSATLAAWLRDHSEAMAAFLAELVATPTENPPGTNYATCAALLERRLRALGLSCERFECQGSSSTYDIASPASTRSAATLMATHGLGPRALYFHGHYDVVPAQSQAQFNPRRDGNFLFGRGSCDMKGGLVAMVYAIAALQECGMPLDGRLVLTMVPDEEAGGALGSAWLAQQGLLGRDGIGMLTAEPTSGVVWNANRGAITLKIEVLGKPAHVGLHYQGENAFERMHRVVDRLLALKREVERRLTAQQVGNEASSETPHQAHRLGPRNSILLIGGQNGGGANFNVVPERCWFTVDRRINPEEDLQTEKNRLLAVLEDCQREGIPLSWEVLQEAPSANCDANHVLGRALSDSIQQVTGSAPQFELCPGLLEIRFYAARGVPAYAYGPGLLSVAHGPNEYLDLRRLSDSALIYALTAVQVLKPSA